jgi:hypothetical protein
METFSLDSHYGEARHQDFYQIIKPPGTSIRPHLYQPLLRSRNGSPDTIPQRQKGANKITSKQNVLNYQSILAVALARISERGAGLVNTTHRNVNLLEISHMEWVGI